MKYSYYEGGGLIRYNNEEKRVETILKYEIDSDSVVEIHIIKDPFPEISINELIENEGDFIIIKDTPQQQISEEDYNRYCKKSLRSSIIK